MRKIVILFVMLGMLLPTVTLEAQNQTTRFFFACNYEDLTVDSTAGGVAFTTSKIKSTACGSGAQSVSFTVTCSTGTDCPIRIQLDGTTTVTTSAGLRLTSGQSATIYGLPNITNFRAIREGATSAVLNTIYYK